MKTRTNLHQVSSRSCSMWVNFTFALLVGSMLPLMVASTSAQTLYFREYAPTAANSSNDGRCIIRLTTGANGNDKFLTVGRVLIPHTPPAIPTHSAHGLWTDAAGAITASTTYDRFASSDYLRYILNRVEDHSVSGSYDENDPNTDYTGLPATGTKNKAYFSGFPVTEQPVTWTTILDPSTHNNVWDHILVSDDYSYGVGVVVDRNYPDNFFVLSQVADNPSGTITRFAVTKYEWVSGYYGHQVAWSKQYMLEDYNLTAVGIVQDADGDVVVAGNAVPSAGGNSRVFTQVIYNTNGNVAYYLKLHNLTDPDYVVNGVEQDWPGDIVASSITYVYSEDDFMISGKAKEFRTFMSNGSLQTVNTERPFLLSLDYNTNVNLMKVYEFKHSEYDTIVLRGEFKYAKKEFRKLPALYGGGNAWTVTAVGRVGDSAIYSTTSDAIITNVRSLDNGSAQPGLRYWATLHQADFTPGTSPTLTVANWFTTLPTPGGDETQGAFEYTGSQSSASIDHTISAAVLKIDGSTECGLTPYYYRMIEPTVTIAEYTSDYNDWGEDVEQRTSVNTVGLTPLQCLGEGDDPDYIAAGKRNYGPVTGRIPTLENAVITSNDEAINIQYIATQDGMVTLLVVDVMGNTLVNQQVNCSAGTHNYSLSTKDWITGSYYVAVISPTSRFNQNILILK